MERFGEFQAAYPKGCNRYLAETAYIDLLLSGKVTEGMLVECARNYAESCRVLGTQEKYIKNAENFLREFVFEKYLPGKYKKPKADTGKQGQFNQFPQRLYDYAELERELLKG
mgnify:FL=1